MSVFNCAPFENENSVDNVGFEVTTQTDDLDTGELAVEGSLKIKGVQGINVAVSGDTVVFGIDPEIFPEYDAGGGDGTDNGTDGGASGDSAGSGSTGGSTGGSGCTCPNIVTFNSVEEMNAANLADGSIACVPSTGGGGGGLPVVNITSVVRGVDATTLSATLTEAESAALSAAATSPSPIIINIPVAIDDDFVVWIWSIFSFCKNDFTTLYGARIPLGEADISLTVVLQDGELGVVMGVLSGNV